MFLRGTELVKDARGVASLVCLLPFYCFWHDAKIVIHQYICHLCALTNSSPNFASIFFYIVGDVASVRPVRSSICSCDNSCPYWITLLHCNCSKRWVCINYLHFSLFSSSNDLFVSYFFDSHPPGFWCRPNLCGCTSIAVSFGPWRPQEAFCRLVLPPRSC